MVAGCAESRFALAWKLSLLWMEVKECGLSVQNSANMDKGYKPDG